jgi:hypothetical protein
MKITVINGSPKGRDSKTNIMVEAFLKGAREAGAETTSIFLAEKEIKHCKGCFSCFFATPGQCSINDDMADILSVGEGTDILVLATPIRYGNISGMLQGFIERMIMLCSPYFEKDPIFQMHRHPKKTPEAELKISFYRSKLVMIASGAIPDREPNFQVPSLWVKRLAFYNHTEVIGEIYAPQGGLLIIQEGDLQPILDNYFELLAKAGEEIATKSSLSEETQNRLSQNLISDDIYIQHVNCFIDEVLTGRQHPYLNANKTNDGIGARDPKGN